MRAAFDLPSDGGTAEGVGVVPSWLTSANAEAVSKAPCINELVEDLGCWYCKPTPKPNTASNAELEAQLARARAAASSAAPGAGASAEAAEGEGAVPAAVFNPEDEFGEEPSLKDSLPEQKAAR